MANTLVYDCDGEEGEPYAAVVVWDEANTGRIQARLGVMTDEDIAHLQNDGLILLWRQGDYGFMARPAPGQQTQWRTLYADELHVEPFMARPAPAQL